MDICTVPVAAVAVAPLDVVGPVVTGRIGSRGTVVLGCRCGSSCRNGRDPGHCSDRWKLSSVVGHLLSLSIVHPVWCRFSVYVLVSGEVWQDFLRNSHRHRYGCQCLPKHDGPTMRQHRDGMIEFPPSSSGDTAHVFDVLLVSGRQ